MTQIHVSSNLAPREALIYRAVRKAVASLRTVAPFEMAISGSARPLGLARVEPGSPMIALGLGAHKDLADVWKRTLCAANFLTPPTDGELSVEDGADLERLFWSCCNTCRLLALGIEAWQSSQLLPFSDRRRFEIPPIFVPPAVAEVGSDVIYVINHEADARRAHDVTDVLKRIRVADVRFAAADLSPDFSQPFFSGAGTIHVHVGRHTAESHQFRITDSLRSASIVLQLDEDHFGSRPAGADAEWLSVEDEYNGFIRPTAESIKHTYEQIRFDHVLRRNMVRQGIASVEQLNKNWQMIASDLTA